MDRYLKIINKLRKTDKENILKLWEKILIGDLTGIKVKKIKGFTNYYRVRIGKLRIVFKRVDGKNILINIDYRKNIYKKIK